MAKGYEQLKSYVESLDTVIYHKGCKAGKFLVNYTLDKLSMLDEEISQFVIQVEYEEDSGYVEIFTESFNMKEEDISKYTKWQYSSTLYKLADNLIGKEVKRLEILNQMFQK